MSQPDERDQIEERCEERLCEAAAERDPDVRTDAVITAFWAGIYELTRTRQKSPEEKAKDRALRRATHRAYRIYRAKYKLASDWL